MKSYFYTKKTHMSGEKLKVQIKNNVYFVIFITLLYAGFALIKIKKKIMIHKVYKEIQELFCMFVENSFFQLL